MYLLSGNVLAAAFSQLKSMSDYFKCHIITDGSDFKKLSFGQFLLFTFSILGIF